MIIKDCFEESEYLNTIIQLPLETRIEIFIFYLTNSEK
jgi:hypothetical protein